MIPYIQKIDETIEFLKNILQSPYPPVGVVIGSGLGAFVKNIEVIQLLPYNEIHHFPSSSVEGHTSLLIIGKIDGKPIVVFNGRRHIYEGTEPKMAVFPVRVFSKLGLKKLIITNAAGGINQNFSVGDLMLVTDHINMMFRNPLIGPNLYQWGHRFPDMSDTYNKELQQVARNAAIDEGIDLKEGVYCGMSGPSYETRAEVEMLKLAGGDAVGMSTIPEVITAVHSHIKVLGLSYISNVINREPEQKITHEEVLRNAKFVEDKFAKLLTGIIKRL